VFDEQELMNAVDASLDFWLTEGDIQNSFPKKLQITWVLICFTDRIGIICQLIGICVTYF
jgi:hypothetical protein